MEQDIVEIECPVCDQRVRADAPRCPHCGAEFAMSGVDELEKVVREINEPQVPRGTATPGPVKGAEVTPAKAEDTENKGFFGKLFKKRR
ncbi:MAG: hypothetical protein SA339_04810 [Methanomassiliicoccus sp.]|nr:hypothetical protein [Methanomassiliicoccus sp.]